MLTREDNGRVDPCRTGYPYGGGDAEVLGTRRPLIRVA